MGNNAVAGGANKQAIKLAPGQTVNQPAAGGCC